MKNARQQTQQERKEPAKNEQRHAPPPIKPLDKGSYSLGREMGNGDGPPGDRGACEKESTTQGSE